MHNIEGIILSAVLINKARDTVFASRDMGLDIKPKLVCITTLIIAV